MYSVKINFYVIIFLLCVANSIITNLDHIHSYDDYLSVLEGSGLQLAQLAAADPSSSFPFHWVVVTQHWRGSRETDVGVACKARRRSLLLMDVV